MFCCCLFCVCGPRECHDFLPWKSILQRRSRMRVITTNTVITRIQYKGSALFDCNIPYRGIWQQTKQMPCRDLLFWRAADLLNHVVLVRREILLVHLAHRRIDLLLALQLPCFSLLVPLDYLRW